MCSNPSFHFDVGFPTVERSPQFDAWIDMYGGDDFEKEVQNYIAMVDVVADAATLKEMRNIPYRTARAYVLGSS
jgi:thiaminase